MLPTNTIALNSITLDVGAKPPAVCWRCPWVSVHSMFFCAIGQEGPLPALPRQQWSPDEPLTLDCRARRLDFAGGSGGRRGAAPMRCCWYGEAF